MKEFVKKLIELSGYRISKIQPRNIQNENQINKDDFFDLYFSRINPEEFFFIQIGANDGKTNDPVYPFVVKYNLSGIVIEPQPDVFKLLKETYKNYPKVKCVNAAIAEKSGSLSFYRAKESVLNEDNYTRITALATFKKDVLVHTLANKIPKGVDVEDCIEEVKIEALSLDSFLLKHNIQKLDMLQIDVEGLDYEILKMLDFSKYTPSLINFESNHINEKDRLDCQSKLESLGYRWFRHGIDTCAYK